MAFTKLFRDRTDAGQQLAQRLLIYKGAHPVVLGLPSGGVPVAFEVARALEAELDLCVVRKIGAPVQPQLAVGAASEQGSVYVDRDTMQLVGMSEAELEAAIETKLAEVEDRVARFRRGRPPIDVHGRTVIVVDDGLATGSTARAALHTLRERGARHLVLAVPVAAAESLDELDALADEIVCVSPEDAFEAVGAFYERFDQTPEQEVMRLLGRGGAMQHAWMTPSGPSSTRTGI